MLQEKTIRSILTFQPITKEMTCDDLQEFNGLFQCIVEYQVTTAARDNEPFILQTRQSKFNSEITVLCKYTESFVKIPGFITL